MRRTGLVVAVLLVLPVATVAPAATATPAHHRADLPAWAVERLSALAPLNRGAAHWLSGRARADAELTFATAGPAPDLDRDGYADVYGVREHIDTDGADFVQELTVSAYSGRTGHRLWQAKAPDEGITFVLAQPVGSPARPGLLFLALDVETFTWHVRALGPDGRMMWDVDLTDPRPGGPGTAAFAGLLPRRGAATDILVALQLGGLNVGVGSDAVRKTVWPRVMDVGAAVLDGAIGKLRDVGVVEVAVGSPLSSVSPVSDLSGDGRPDLLVATGLPERNGRLAAYASGDGTLLWRTDPMPLGDWVTGQALPDVTGSHTPDLVASLYTTDFWGGTFTHESAQLLLDGADGSVVRRVTGDLDGIAAFRDVDRDGTVELLRHTAVSAKGRSGIRLTVETAAGKRVGWQRDLTLAGDANGLAGGAVPAEDISGDGIADVGWGVYRDSGSAVVDADGGYLDGRTGRPLPDLTGEGLAGTVDGHGNDSATVLPGAREARLTAYDGASRRALVGTVIRWATPLSARSAWAFAAPIRGRCAAIGVVVTGQDPNGGQASWFFLVDGVTGRLLWYADLLGTAAGRVSATPGRARARC